VCDGNELHNHASKKGLCNRDEGLLLGPSKILTCPRKKELNGPWLFPKSACALIMKGGLSVEKSRKKGEKKGAVVGE